jgi:hypothetical protein
LRDATANVAARINYSGASADADVIPAEEQSMAKTHMAFCDGLTLCGRDQNKVRWTNIETKVDCRDCNKIMVEYWQDVIAEDSNYALSA